MSFCAGFPLPSLPSFCYGRSPGKLWDIQLGVCLCCATIHLLSTRGSRHKKAYPDWPQDLSDLLQTPSLRARPETLDQRKVNLSSFEAREEKCVCLGVLAFTIKIANAAFNHPTTEIWSICLAYNFGNAQLFAKPLAAISRPSGA